MLPEAALEFSYHFFSSSNMEMSFMTRLHFSKYFSSIFTAVWHTTAVPIRTIVDNNIHHVTCLHCDIAVTTLEFAHEGCVFLNYILVKKARSP